MTGSTQQALQSVAYINRLLYQQLASTSSIRLLSLQPGRGDEAVTCKLLVLDDLDAAPAYEALSYCWGDAATTSSISCNDDQAVMTVTTNLLAALKRLRRETGCRLLWIDAICINQHDLAERSQQVAKMNAIYGAAQRVVVWLGIIDDSFKEVVELIRIIAHRQASSSPWQNTNTPVPFHTGSLPDPSHSRWKDLVSFFDLPWFFRVWVIQEVQSCAAVKVMCGDDVLDWVVVRAAAAWVRASPEGLKILHGLRNSVGNMGAYMGTTQVHFMGNAELTTHQDVPFLRVLDRAMSFRASDPRDKIFALLTFRTTRCACREDGTWRHCRIPNKTAKQPLKPDLSLRDTSSGRHPSLALGMVIDYGMSVVEVLRILTLHSMIECRSLETLNYAWKQRRELFARGDHLHDAETAIDTTRYLSWVPQWDAVINNRRPHIRAYLYNASLERVPILIRTLNPNIIALRGVLVDTIRETNITLSTDLCVSEPLVGYSATPMRSPMDNLPALSRILTQDHKHDVEGRFHNVDEPHARAIDLIEEHFSNFAAYMLKIVAGRRGKVFISTNSITCHACNGQITNIHRPHDREVTARNCAVCHMGAFDICPSCWQAGKRCLSATHNIKTRTVQGFWCHATDAVTDRLKLVAQQGNARAFEIAVGSASDRRAVFRTSQGCVGVCPLVAAPGDLIVVLYGGRTPFVLRAESGHFRLVSDCYMYGMMDGEAIKACEKCWLQAQDFLMS